MIALRARCLVSVAALGWLAAASPSLAADTYVGATVDSAAGLLRIERAKGKPIVFELDSAQVEFHSIAISADRRSVGWLAVFPNCCTSYPIPLQLKVYSDGRIRAFEGWGLPVWRWMFVDGGRRVAFEQEPVHGGIGVHYELRDVATGRLVGQYDPPTPDSPPSGKDVPAWVAQLDADQ